MAFVSEAQRKFVMAKLKKSGFRQKPIKISQEGKYYHARIVSPKRFQGKSFRTVKAGHSKIIVGRLKGRKTTSTQSILIPK